MLTGHSRRYTMKLKEHLHAIQSAKNYSKFRYKELIRGNLIEKAADFSRSYLV